jgi:hypothetical protein
LPRPDPFELTLGDADNLFVVRYTVKKRPRFLSVRFQGPAGPLVRPTGCERDDANFHAAAKTLIKEAYGLVGKLAPALVLLTDAIGQVIRENPGLRPATVAGYRGAVASVLTVLPFRRVCEFDRLAADR